MAQMWTCIIKNDGASPVMIEDLGITVDATSQIDFHEQFDYTDIADSDDLRDLVTAGTLVINDGTSDLSPADGTDFLAIVHIYYLEDYLGDNYYTQTELGTSGQSSVHWDNITNVPDFGSLHWIDPGIARIIQFSATPPPAPAAGDFYIDTDDDHLYKYNGATWDDQGAPTTGDRVIDLDSTAQVVFEWGGASWDIEHIPSEGDAIIITDDGDGKSAMYTYTNANEWVKIADVDILSGTLQQAYENGSTITITDVAGPVTYDSSSSTSSAINITPINVTPTTNLTDGDIQNIDGRMYMYDSTAGVFMSFDRPQAVFGRKGKTQNQFLNVYVGGMASNNSGVLIPENAIITKIWGMLKDPGVVDIEIYKNDNYTTAIATLEFTASDKEVLADVNVTLTAEDHLQAYAVNATKVDDVVILVEYAYTK